MTSGGSTPARATDANVVVPLQPLLEAMSDGVLIVDDGGRRTYANRALNELVGVDARLPLRSKAPPPWLHVGEAERYRTIVARTAPPRPEVGEWMIVDALGITLTLTVTIIALRRNHTGSLWLFAGDMSAAQLAPHTERLRRLERSLGRIAAEIRRAGIVGDPTGIGADLAPFEALSPRENDVLDLILEGHRVVSIAERLAVSEHTVRNHLKSIFRKLGVHSQAELVELVRGANQDR